MLPRFPAWLNDLPIADPGQRHQALVLQNILLVLLVAYLLLGTLGVLARALDPARMGGANVLTVAAILATLLMLRLGRLRTAITATIGLTLGSATLAVASEHLSVYGTVTIAYIVPIAMAGLLLRRWAMLLVTGLCIGLVTAIFVLRGPSRAGAEAVVAFAIVAGMLAVLLDRYRAGWERSIALARADELRLQLVLDRTPIAVAMSDPDLIVTYWNPAAVRLFGWNATEVVGRSLADTILGGDRISTESLQHQLRDQSSTTSGVREHRTRDGRQIVCEWHNTSLFDVEGVFIGTLGMAQDVTERLRRETAIRELNVELERRVAERTAELAAKNRELEVFAYSVSHDLKAPLRGLDGYSRLLFEEYADRLEGDGAHFLAMIRKATANMGELIDDLLAYSRVERRALRIGSVALRPLAGLIVAEYGETLAEAAVDVRIELPDLAVRAEEEGMAQALRNLIENAIKFSCGVASPQIVLGGERHGDTCLIWVRDNGAGFAMEYHDRIFELFQRLHRAEEYPGTGIGLAIVRKAVERMGGTVWAESAPGAGATFFLRLPLAPQEAL
ncbi:MAG: PAS domain S-box protein [Chloroflexales bacterium]|nr:PAS domain S-box protein [Chloroflexales bacterium]